MDFPPPGTIVAGKYRLEALLGVGGMGAVYRARHMLMDSDVALKWLRADMIGSREARERLIREAQSIARIRHPNVVQVFDVDIHDGSPFMVMELLEGETFGELIAQRTLTTQRVIQLLIGALQGLAAAHERGIVHRDVKPENIFVARTRQHPEGIAKLLDFGVSKIEKLDPNSRRLTQTGLAVGTPLYMSMEQLTQTSEVDGRADLYAFGVVLYHALSGNLPFDGETFAGVVLSIATTKPRPLKHLRPELPTALDRVVMKAMARRREDRYPNAEALIAALRGVEDSLGQSVSAVAYATTLTPRMPGEDPSSIGDEDSFDAVLREGERKRRRLGVSAVLLAALTFGGLWWSRHATTPATVSAGERPPAAAPPAPSPAIAASPAASEQMPDALAPRTPEPDTGAPPVMAEPPRATRRKVERSVEPRPVGAASVHKPASQAATRPKPVREAPRAAPSGKSGALLREDF
jgi:eukaryotic-like serine/threonine-protein kinase